MATATWAGRAQEGQYGGTVARRVDWAADTVKVMLTTATWAPDVDAHDFKDDVTNEVTGTNYTAGGVTLASKIVTYDTATNETRLDAADASWTTVTIAATRRAAIYKDTGTAATSPLLGWVDFGGDEALSAANFTIQWDATGVLKTTVT